MPLTTVLNHSLNLPPVDEGALKGLEARIQKELGWVVYPSRDWVIPRQHPNGQEILDVLIIGGGQGGLAVAYGLMRERVTRIKVVDENPLNYAGPWRTFARMITLRTPKYVTGPDLGIPNLTVRAWFEAQYGEAAWESMHLIPKEMWADYLAWYRDLLKIPVESNTRAGAVSWNDAARCFEIPITGPNGATTYYARKVLLATGIDGSGAWDVPDLVKNNLDKSRYAHTREDIDFEALKGKRIGVLGAGASAFDNASVALEAGAGEVHLFFRRKTLPNINPYRWAEFVGFLRHHSDLPDPLKWRFVLKILQMGQLPPTDTFERATQFPQFTLHREAPWESVKQDGDTILVQTPKGTVPLDYIIIGTGFITDLSRRPELAHVYPHIALWQDRYRPPAEEAHNDLARHPYMGSSFEFQEKHAGQAPYLAGLFNYTFGGLASLGFGGGSISGMKYSVPKLVGGITRQLYLDDIDAHYQSLCAFDLREFQYE